MTNQEIALQLTLKAAVYFTGFTTFPPLYHKKTVKARRFSTML